MGTIASWGEEQQNSQKQNVLHITRQDSFLIHTKLKVNNFKPKTKSAIHVFILQSYVLFYKMVVILPLGQPPTVPRRK